LDVVEIRITSKFSE